MYRIIDVTDAEQSHDHHHADASPWKRLRHAVIPHSHDANESIQAATADADAGIRAAWVGLAGMGATALLQILIVAISGSIALLADTLHNVSHAATTIPLIIAFRLGRRPPTARYPYGFRRAEDLAGVLIAVMIAASAVYILWESVRAFLDPEPLANLGWVFAAGVVGALGNELVAIYRIRVGGRIGSAALIAEGQHARADGLTSLAVILGVLGVWAGIPQADATVGLLIAGAILWILVRTSQVIFRRLMDGVDDGTVERIHAAASTVEGVVDVAGVRARWTGHRLQTELSIEVEAGLGVEAGHQIAADVRCRLTQQIRHIESVTVAVQPAAAATLERRAAENLSTLHDRH